MDVPPWDEHAMDLLNGDELFNAGLDFLHHGLDLPAGEIGSPGAHLPVASPFYQHVEGHADSGTEHPSPFKQVRHRLSVDAGMT